MRSLKSFEFYIVLALLALASLGMATRASAQTVSFVHNFNDNGKDGFHPWAGLVFDSAGNLYGTTQRGGTKDNGTAFELTRNSNGIWTEKILHSFLYDGIDGYDPNGGVILDSAGNLYGATAAGGNGSCTNPFGIVIGCGTVYELVRASDGSFTEKILYNFQKRQGEGVAPWAGLIFDSAGNLYGTTVARGTGYGTVFELSPSTTGEWTETILMGFSKTTGSEPRGALIFDAKGNLYGTTQSGGALKYGTVFELSPSSGGSWTQTVLHNFSINSTDVAYPVSSLIFDALGNLYGTASYGGQTGGGGVFELSPTTSGTWTETILYFFTGVSTGYNSWSPLIFDSAGNLYGTTSTGGTGKCAQIGIVFGCGTIFKLTPSDGAWTHSIVYSFNFRPNNDPEGPEGSGLISDSSGNFYGTTYAGGAYTHGTVFELKP
jgi:uncharacterized repeat protein (TIGR03803 family)